MISDHEEEDDQVVSINNWKTEHIEDFLKEKLVREASA